MIVFQNIFTVCNYMIHKTFGFMVGYHLFYDDTQDDFEDDDEEPCHCNLCSTTRNVILFVTRRLKCNKSNQ